MSQICQLFLDFTVSDQMRHLCVCMPMNLLKMARRVKSQWSMPSTNMSYSFALQTVRNEITLIQQRDISRVLLSVVFRVRSFYKAVCRLWGVWGHHWTESCCVPVACDAQWLTYVNAVDDHSSAAGPQHVLHYTQPLSSVVLALLLLLIVVRMWAEKLLHLSVEESFKSLRLHWKLQIVFSFIHWQSFRVLKK